MATLTRTRALVDDDDLETHHDIRLGVPTPFPITIDTEEDDSLANERLQPAQKTSQDGHAAAEDNISSGYAKDTLATERLQLEQSAQSGQETSTTEDVHAVEEGRVSPRYAEDLLPSIGQVQNICLATLNDLLSTSATWTPIVPDRRHSTPASPFAAGSSTAPAASHRSSALQTLVSNLRVQDSGGQMVETADSLSETELLYELRTRVTALAATLPPRDAELARTLVSLLSNFHRLSYISPLAVQASPSTGRVASWNAGTDTSAVAMALSDPYSTLRRQVSDFQLERSWSTAQTPASGELGSLQPAQSALLWSLIDDDLENVLSLCRHQGELDPFADGHLPPEYDPMDYKRDADVDSLPEYEAGSAGLELHRKASYKAGSALDNTNSRVLDATSEKMRMDLEAVTLAIDRLYLVAPQLHDQRVELKKSKVEEMEKAKRKGKHKYQDSEMALKDLDRMVELIGKASQRKIADQTVLLDSRAMQDKLARARQKDNEKRAAFVDTLAQHSNARRLHSQDAIFTPPGKRSRSHTQLSSQMADPHAMLSLPEFIREGVPEAVQRRMDIERDPEALLTLPEFIKQNPSPEALRPGHPNRGQSISYSAKPEDVPPVSPTVTRLKGSRSRSMSEPLAWLLPKSSSPSNSASRKLSKKNLRTVSPGQTSPVPELISSLDVSYVAEYHENLQHILVFLTVSAGLQAGHNLEAEVVPPEHGNDGRSRLLLRCGANISQPLELPVVVNSGPVAVSVVGGQHFQVKLAVPNASASPQLDSSEPDLDATHFQAIRPTSFICSSCSLPLVRATQLKQYRDLPSEHWAELVDAWMCHADQTLHEHVQKNTRDGFWPVSGEALVGASYLLIHGDAIVKDNLYDLTAKDIHQDCDDWSRARCICGAVIGRCQPHSTEGENPAMVYRLAKYAFRPVGPGAEPSRIPLSAFIVGDMTEYVHAHATYRFVITDEEEEKPRILVWLFKPSMRISYSTPRQFVIPKSGSIRAAKVLFKTLGPFVAASELQTILAKYPGFPQAEHISYPFEICRRLAALLKESNTAYPVSLRQMTGLDVGWLQRS